MGQPLRLEAVAGREQDAEQRARADPARAEPRHAPGGDRGERGRRDREANREEREQRVEGDRVLDLDEGDAPDRGDGDEREQRGHPPTLQSK